MNLRHLHRALLASAVTVLAFGAAPAMALPPPPSPTPFGSCDGTVHSGGCTAATGHASVSVTSTLSVNEMASISFGNIASGALIATDSLVLDTTGARTAGGDSGTNGFSTLLLHGAKANDGLGGSPGAVGSGAQHPGHYTITGGAEDASATQVYISFADSGGAPIDMCDSNTGGVMSNCDGYHSATKVPLKLGGSGATGFNMNHFVINQAGSDVYGHYVANDGTVVAPGLTTPFSPGSPHSGTSTGVGVNDVVVGATLWGAVGTPAVGKYEGTFNIMASY